ncbi:MAG: PEP/pyruvate-binding domain-containing protein [Thermodesulfobacteriota bacterium]|nr:PEP/pyruvate-binding domain-containing protein [Thermodesulfobacteriota bacterium]
MKITDLFSKENSCRLLVNLEGKLAEKYKWYREFLVHNQTTLQIISHLERLTQGSEPFTLQGVKGEYLRLFDATAKLVDALNNLSGGKYDALSRVCRDIHDQIEPLFAIAGPLRSDELVLSLEELKPHMVGITGSKASNLATAGNELGLPTPPGFVITANAFWSFIEQNDLHRPIDEMVAAVSYAEPDHLESAAKDIQKRILKSPVPPSLAEAILNAYDNLELKTEKGVSIAVRSTAVGEDTEASFAGQYTTVLNVGKKELLEAYKTVLASKYSPRAIQYRMHCGLDDRETPMCVACITMIDALASGVCYSRDPSLPTSSELLVSATWGLGEYLVSGEASPDTFYVDRKSFRIKRKEIADKPHRIAPLSEKGTRLEETPETARQLPAIDDDVVRLISEYSLKLEDHFGSPQDVEWCIDRSGRLFILQSRPLGLAQSRQQDVPEVKDYPGYPVLLSKGNSASRGTVSGRVVLPTSPWDRTKFEDAILVAKTASPEYAKLADSVKGIITDLGSVASHLASVAREFGIPMIVNAGTATTDLIPGATITMVADTTTVFGGKVDELAETTGLPRDKVFKSSAHLKMDTILSKISPLNLTDPEAPTFSPKHCKTLHDVIRYSHERVVKEMFGLSRQTAESTKSVKMTSNIPVALYFVDLGGGLKENLTTCDDITPEAIACLPMKALWRGLSYPGVNWSGAIGVNTQNMMALMTSGPPPQMASYAILSSEYVNLSIKFGYHYATIDILWSDNVEDNYISLQFGGGAGSIHGRSMRIHFLSEVLQQLGFILHISGDVLDATAKGYDSPAMEETLDQLGRLLACSRLLDLTIQSQDRVDSMKTSFFSGNYDFLQQSDNPLPNFYTPIGDWARVVEDGVTRCLQDGSKSGEGFSCSLKNMMGKMVGHRYKQFLDNIKAYHYFPIAILKDSYIKEGLIRVTVTPEAGCLDNMGGLVFGLRNISNFFVLSLDALENNVSLFEFSNGRRVKKVGTEKNIESGTKYVISVQIQGAMLKGFLDEDEVFQFDAETSFEGYVGLWTKADSKVYFDDMTIQEGDSERVVNF